MFAVVAALWPDSCPPSGCCDAPAHGCLNIHAQPAAARCAGGGADPPRGNGGRCRDRVTIMQDWKAGLDTGRMLPTSQPCPNRTQTTGSAAPMSWRLLGAAAMCGGAWLTFPPSSPELAGLMQPRFLRPQDRQDGKCRIDWPNPRCDRYAQGARLCPLPRRVVRAGWLSGSSLCCWPEEVSGAG